MTGADAVGGGMRGADGIPGIKPTPAQKLRGAFRKPSSIELGGGANPMSRGRLTIASCPRRTRAALPACVAALLLLCAIGVHAAEPCGTEVGRIVFLKGRVDVTRDKVTTTLAPDFRGTLCAGDELRVHVRSQATVLLGDETPMRIDERTVVRVAPANAADAPLVDVEEGAVYVISRRPRQYRIRTPFINAQVEGTEFLVEVGASEVRVRASGTPAFDIDHPVVLKFAVSECLVFRRDLSVDERDTGRGLPEATASV